MTECFHSLTKQIALDPYNSIVFSTTDGKDIYVVGGFTRDILANRVTLDRDYVVGGEMESFVGEVVRQTNGRLVKLGEEGLLRIALKGGGTLDFTPLKGDNIKRDLSFRDFTINAIAWSPGSGWIDPMGGIDDLKAGLIRMINPLNLTSDPVRILRAYRFAGELSFEIERTTRNALRRSADHISNTSSERITSEFFKILNLNYPVQTLFMMLEDGLLTKLILSKYKDLEVRVKALTHLFKRSSESNIKYCIKWEQIISQGLKQSGLLALALLLRDMPRHRFTFSSSIAGRISRLEKATALLQSRNRDGMFDREDLYDVFEAAGEETPALLMLRNLPQYLREFRDYQRIQKKCLLSAEQIRDALNTQTGPVLGKAIRIIRRAEFVGHIKDIDDALTLLKTPLS